MKINSPYLDVLYEAQPDCKTIQITVGDWSEKFAALHGGLRMISTVLPDTLVGKDLTVAVNCDGAMTVGRIASRNEWHEPLGIKSNPREIEECLDNASNIQTSIQWFATWKCNYKCSYCWQETTRDSYRKIKNANKTPEDWIDAFLRISPEEFYISGGEPTVLPGIIEVVNGVGCVIPIKMTSNLGNSFDVEKWIKEVDPDHIDCVTFSFHPTQQSWEEYSSKMRRFAHAFGGHKVGAELVMHPGQKQFESNIRSIQKELHLRTINIDIYHVQPAKFPPSPGRDAKKCPNLDANISTLKRQRPDKTNPVYCSAGVNRINVDPRGDAYTCMSAIDRSKMFGRSALPHYAPIGNVFDQTFSLNKDPVLCWESFRCSACDASIVKNSWTRHPFPYELPLPE